MNAAIRTELKQRVEQERRLRLLRAGDTSGIDITDPHLQPLLHRLAASVCLDSPVDLVQHVKQVATVVLTAKARG